MAGTGYASWLLPDDGIIDLIAVEIAARGTRRVRLTAPERRAAAALIVARSGTANDIARRLGMSGHAAKQLAVSVRADAAAELGEVA
jgi:hypothetical protein